MRRAISVLLLVLFAGSLRAETVDELLKAASGALKEGKLKDALPLLDRAIAMKPKDIRSFLIRGSVYGALVRYQESLDDFDKAIAQNPKAAAGYQQRGMAQFKLGRFAESIKDFDKAIELEPERKAGHWQRGISYYYAGRFDEGARQFEGYQKVDGNDVENAVWRYLCMARKDGPAKARTALLKIGKDARVPMKEIYELFAGRVKPADVLAAASADKPPPAQLNQQLFYAHLYLGLYYETEGDKKKAFAHLAIATDKHRIGHYMWDVARVHRNVLRDELKK